MRLETAFPRRALAVFRRLGGQPGQFEQDVAGAASPRRRLLPLLGPLFFLALLLVIPPLRAESAETPRPSADQPSAAKDLESPAPPAAEDGPPPALSRLIRAYPEHLDRAEKSDAGWLLVWKDGTRIAWDDGRTKDETTRFDEADLEDMFSQPYPKGREGFDPPWGVDPGRFRCASFFLKMYGDSAQAVSARLRAVDWPSASGHAVIWVTTVNGVDKKAASVARELSALPMDVKRWLDNSSCFAWRRIAGEKTLSVHSFGAAIDIAPEQSRYWRWDKDGGRRRDSRPPPEIVDIFEKYGFIWGGKWSHYDDMHFEYRPELLIE